MEGSCIISGLGSCYPTRQACIDAGGVPLSDEYIEAAYTPSTNTPIASPPPQVTFVTPDCQPSELGEIALDLFQDAYLDEDPLQSDIEAWQTFVQEINQTDTDSPVISALIELARPQARPEDQSLLFSLISSTDQVAVRELSQEVEDRLINYSRTGAMSYTGWESARQITPEGVFGATLVALMGELPFEEMLNELLATRLPEVLVTLSQDQAEEIRQLPLAEFTELLNQTYRESLTTPTGTRLLVRISRFLSDLTNIALARGLSMRAYSLGQFFERVMPGLDEEVYLTLFELSEVAETDELMDNRRLVSEFDQLFEQMARGYLQSERGSELRASYASALHNLYQVAPRFGRTIIGLDARIDFLAAQLGVELYSEEQAPSLRTWNTGEQYLVGPSGLPEEIVQILRDTGYYELVSNNLREISFTPEINEGDSIISRDASGLAYSALRSIRIDYLTSEGEIIPAWSIAATLIHEASHVAWGRAVREELLQSTPDERQAFLNEARFLERYLQHGLEQGELRRGSAEVRRIASNIVYARLAGRASNRVLGFELNNYEPFVTDLPSDEFLQSHGLTNVRDLDLDGYPTDLMGGLVIDQLPELVGSLRLSPHLQMQAYEMFSLLLRGDAVIEGRLTDPDNSVLWFFRRVYRSISREMSEPLAPFSGQVYIDASYCLQLLSAYMVERETQAYLRDL